LAVGKLAARRGQEGVKSRLIYLSAFLHALALNSPIVAGVGEGYEVYTGVFATQVLSARKLIPKPNFAEPISVEGVGLEIGLHNALKASAFIVLRKGGFPVFV
jgi:hypothetical protein